MKAIRVLIVDDVTQVRQDLRTVLALVGDADTEHPIEVVGEAANGLEAIHQADALQPDVVLMDLEMPVLNDYEAARQKAVQVGMDAFIVKGAPVEILVQTISRR